MSRNNKKFVNLMTEGIRVTKYQHFEMPLPLKDSKLRLSNNKEVARKRQTVYATFSVGSEILHGIHERHL